MSKHGISFNFKQNKMQPTFGNLFYYKETIGMPIDVVCSKLKESGITVNWAKFYIDGLKAGCNIDGLITSMEHCIQDVYGKHYFEEWQKSFRMWINIENDNIIKEVWGNEN